MRCSTNWPRWLVGGLLLTLLAIAIQHTVQSRADAVRRQVDKKKPGLGPATPQPLHRRLADANRRLASGSTSTPAENQLRENHQPAAGHPRLCRIRGDLHRRRGHHPVINPAAERLFGYRADELIDKATPQILHPDEHAPAGRSKVAPSA